MPNTPPSQKNPQTLPVLVFLLRCLKKWSKWAFSLVAFLLTIQILSVLQYLSSRLEVLGLF